MNRNRFGELEVLCASPRAEREPAAKNTSWQHVRRLLGLERRHDRPALPPPARSSLLFVHGAFTAAWCWEEHFLPWFAARGYNCYALSLSGHGSSRERAMLDLYGIDDYVADVAEVVAALPEPPVLIGHSMGGMVVQKYLETAPAAGVVLMASVPPSGLLSSAFGLLMNNPLLLQDANRLFVGESPASERIGAALFHQTLSALDLQRFASLAQPESTRAIWDMTCFNLPRRQAMHEAPMLVLGAEFDHIIPPALVEATARDYEVEAQIFPDMGHGMMLETDWPKVATAIAEWLEGVDAVEEPGR